MCGNDAQVGNGYVFASNQDFPHLIQVFFQTKTEEYFPIKRQFWCVSNQTNAGFVSILSSIRTLCCQYWQTLEALYQKYIYKLIK